MYRNFNLMLYVFMGIILILFDRENSNKLKLFSMILINIKIWSFVIE